ncbi:hypothetical protein G9A89_002516 [Geosiphon pyriformis]|nr:hypothetical protein G9A89_002516 [Geosiphon pyriformis]
MIIIADQRISESISYRQKGILQRVTEIHKNTHLRKNWRILQDRFPSDAIMILGNLMDRGSELESQEWEDELHRYNLIFSPRYSNQSIPVFYLAGNYDIGVGKKVDRKAYLRFSNVLGPTNFVHTLGNHTIVGLDTITLSGEDDSLKKEGLELLDQLENESYLPIFLYTTGHPTSIAKALKTNTKKTQ